MDHPVKLLAGKERSHGRAVREIGALEAKAGQRREQGEARLPETHRVVVVEVVYPHYLMAVATEPARHMKSDKPGGAGDEVLHRSS